MHLKFRIKCTICILEEDDQIEKSLQFFFLRVFSALREQDGIYFGWIQHIEYKNWYRVMSAIFWLTFSSSFA